MTMTFWMNQVFSQHHGAGSLLACNTTSYLKPEFEFSDGQRWTPPARSRIVDGMAARNGPLSQSIRQSRACHTLPTVGGEEDALIGWQVGWLVGWQVGFK